MKVSFWGKLVQWAKQSLQPMLDSAKPVLKQKINELAAQAATVGLSLTNEMITQAVTDGLNKIRIPVIVHPLVQAAIGTLHLPERVQELVTSGKFKSAEAAIDHLIEGARL